MLVIFTRRGDGSASRWLAGVLLLLAGTVPVYGQATSSTSNAMDRLNFGDTGTDAYSESAHAFVNMGNPTGTGALGLTYREIASSPTAANAGNDADNEFLTFTMKCDPALQNYLTIQVWGSDTISDFIYLYTPVQGFGSGNYSGTNQPEIDNQGWQPTYPGRWVYETATIPLSMTSSKTSVTLTLDANNLATGKTSRPIYAAFTHTNPYLTVSPSDPQGTAPAAAAPTPATYDSALYASILSQIAGYVAAVEANQIYGPAWDAAVLAGTVPPQIIGASGWNGINSTPPASQYSSQTDWLNAVAVYQGGLNSGNNVAMQRLEMMSFAYSTPNFLTTYYQDPGTEQRIVAELDSDSYMQALDGCFGDVLQWDGVGATTPNPPSNPYGRQNSRCSPIEGQGSWAIGAAIVEMQNDSAFLAALNQPISDTLEPGVLRYQAYQTMLVNLIGFLTGPIGHGHAPNQDLLAAKSYVWANLALRVLDNLYHTSLARSNAQMYTDYLNETTGLAPIDNNPADGYWISQGGLGLEKNGTLNGSFDGGYGMVDVGYLSWLAKILNDYGIETESSHPVRDVALSATSAFSSFLYPGLVPARTGYQTTLLQEQFLTFRWSANVGPTNALSEYWSAAELNDPIALHGFYLEHANGIVMGVPVSDDGVEGAMHWYADYVKLCEMVNSQPNDPTGVTFLNEPAHPDGVWADPTGSTISIKHAGESLEMTLNWRPLMTPKVGTALSLSEPMDNVARVHDTTATMSRLATIRMPASTASGASGNYTSGAAGTLFVGRYGNYLVGLNWQSTATMMALAPDMTQGTATDLVSGTNYDLTRTTSVPVPASGAVALFQSLPTPTLSGSSINFGSVVTGSSSAPQTVTVTNSGTGPLLISTASLGGSQAADFAYATSCGSALLVNASCTFTVTFTPTATGARSGALSLTTSASATPQVIALTGTGTAPKLTVSTSSLNFTEAAGSTTTPQTITLSNTGTAALTISGIAIGGANATGFAEKSTCGASLAAGAECTLSINFAPSATGAYIASITITSNSSGSPLALALTGMGTASAGGSSGAADFSLASVSSASMTAGGSTVIPLTVTASNGFNQPITFSCSVASAAVSCTFASPVLTPTAATTSTQVTVQYPANTAAINAPRRRGSDVAILLGGAGLAVNGSGFGSRRKRRSIKRRRVGLLALLSLSALALIAGCGVGSHSQTATSNTPATTHTLIITGVSGQITHSATVTFVVTS